ncbi:MAG: DegT/DnrJ/EryC1/StrS family aminotransferase [Myxococcota bacterium]
MIPRRRYFIENSDLLISLEYLIGGGKGDPDEPCEIFGKRFCAKFGFSGFALFSLGRIAMGALLDACRLPAGCDILLPALGFGGTPNILKERGFNPIFVDTSPKSLFPTASLLANVLTPRASAYISLHIFGYPAPLEEIVELCKVKNLMLIEDCAHGPGIKYNGKEAGRAGEGAFFSFNLLKPINSYVGGMAATNNPLIAERLAKIAVTAQSLDDSDAFASIAKGLFQNLLFASPLYTPVALAFGNPATERLIRLANSWFFSEKSAAKGFHPLLAEIADGRLDSLEARIKKRLEIARRFDEALGVCNRLHNFDSDARANGYFYPVKAKEPVSEIRKRFLAAGVDVGVRSEICDFLPESNENFPNAYSLWNSLLQIPLYEKMAEKDIEHIATTLKIMREKNRIEALRIDG